MAETTNRTATIETNKGTITFELFEAEAPITTQNFIELAERAFYDGLTFHRYVANFVIQGGCPQGTGTGGSGRNIPLEVTPKLKHGAPGGVAMARSQQPDSASSQFYITVGPADFLDMQYAVFGRVTSGLDVALSLREGDRMTKVSIG